MTLKLASAHVGLDGPVYIVKENVTREHGDRTANISAHVTTKVPAMYSAVAANVLPVHMDKAANLNVRLVSMELDVKKLANVRTRNLATQLPVDANACQGGQDKTVNELARQEDSA